MQSRPLGNLADFAVGSRRLERAGMRSDDLAKRIVRIATSAGEIGLRFAGDERLRDGDVIFADESVVVAVSVDPDDVLVMRPSSIAAAIAIAHALGNRHLPVVADGDALVVRYDPLLEALADAHGVAITRDARVMTQPFRHAHAPHQHD